MNVKAIIRQPLWNDKAAILRHPLLLFETWLKHTVVALFYYCMFVVYPPSKQSQNRTKQTQNHQHGSGKGRVADGGTHLGHFGSVLCRFGTVLTHV